MQGGVGITTITLEIHYYLLLLLLPNVVDYERLQNAITHGVELGVRQLSATHSLSICPVFFSSFKKWSIVLKLAAAPRATNIAPCLCRAVFGRRVNQNDHLSDPPAPGQAQSGLASRSEFAVGVPW